MFLVALSEYDQVLVESDNEVSLFTPSLFNRKTVKFRLDGYHLMLETY